MIPRRSLPFLLPALAALALAAPASAELYFPAVYRGHRLARTPEMVARYGGATASAAVYGHYLYRNISGQIEVVDISAPLAPRAVGRITLARPEYDFDVLTELFVAGGRLWARFWGTWVVLDLADPARPREIGRVETRALATDDGRRALIWGADARGYGVQVVDLTEPAAPRRRGVFHSSGEGVWDLALAGDHGYVVEAYRGLHVLDVRDPDHPTGVALLELVSIRDMLLAGDRLFLSGGGLTVVDVSEPAAPRILGRSSPCPGSLSRILAVRGATLFVSCAGDGSGLRVLDVADPAHIATIGALPGPPASAGALGDAAIYLQGGPGMQVVDLEDPRSPREVLAWPTLGRATHVASAGDLVWVTDTDAGRVHVFDGTRPDAPRSLGSVALPGPFPQGATPHLFSAIAADGSLAVVSWQVDVPGSYEISDRLSVLDGAIPEAPREVARLVDAVDADQILLTGSRLFVTDSFDALRLFDLDDPAAPREAGRIAPFPTQARALAVDGSYAFVGTDEGLLIVDTADPTAPRLVGEWHTPPWASPHYVDEVLFVEVRDARALVGTRGGTAVELTMLDVSDPTRPRELGRLPTDISPGASLLPSVIAGDAFAVAAWRALDVYDLRRTWPSERFAQLMVPGQVQDLAAVGPFVWVADGEAGLLVVDPGR